MQHYRKLCGIRSHPWRHVCSHIAAPRFAVASVAALTGVNSARTASKSCAIEHSRRATARDVLHTMLKAPVHVTHGVCHGAAGGKSEHSDAAELADCIHMLECPQPPPAWWQLANAVAERGLHGLREALAPELVVLPQEGCAGVCRLGCHAVVAACMDVRAETACSVHAPYAGGIVAVLQQ
jgi:hypothetical protein